MWGGTPGVPPSLRPLPVLRYPPQRGEIPATPPHTLKKNALRQAFRFHTARKSVTVARLGPEKKGRGKRGFSGSLFRVFAESELHINYSQRTENKRVKHCKYIRYVLQFKCKIKQLREIGKCKATNQRPSSTPSPTVSTPSPP